MNIYISYHSVIAICPTGDKVLNTAWLIATYLRKWVFHLHC